MSAQITSNHIKSGLHSADFALVCVPLSIHVLGSPSSQQNLVADPRLAQIIHSSFLALTPPGDRRFIGCAYTTRELNLLTPSADLPADYNPALLATNWTQDGRQPINPSFNLTDVDAWETGNATALVQGGQYTDWVRLDSSPDPFLKHATKSLSSDVFSVL